MLDTASASVATLVSGVADPSGRALHEPYPDHLAVHAGVLITFLNLLVSI